MTTDTAVAATDGLLLVVLFEDAFVVADAVLPRDRRTGIRLWRHRRRVSRPLRRFARCDPRAPHAWAEKITARHTVTPRDIDPSVTRDHPAPDPASGDTLDGQPTLRTSDQASERRE